MKETRWITEKQYKKFMQTEKFIRIIDIKYKLKHENSKNKKYKGFPKQYKELYKVVYKDLTL